MQPARRDSTIRTISATTEAPDAAQLGLSEDLRALAMINLGIAQTWAAQLEDAGRHLEQGVALARRTGRPFLKLTGLAHGALAAGYRSYALGAQQSKQAIELAHRHGWGEDQAVGVASAILGWAMVGQARLADAESSLERARQTLRTETEPAAGMHLHYARGVLALARGRNEEALAHFQATEQLAGTLVTAHTLGTRMRSLMLQARLRLARPNASKPPSPGWTPASAKAPRCAPPWHHRGSPSTTRRRRRPRSRPSSTVRSPPSSRCGW